MPVRPANPEALEWPSPIRAGFGQYEKTYRQLRRLHPEGASRWRVAMLRAEWGWSDGEFESQEKWELRADRIDREIREGIY